MAFDKDQPFPNKENLSDVLSHIVPQEDCEKVGKDKFMEICKQVETEFFENGGIDGVFVPNEYTVVYGDTPQVRARLALKWAVWRRRELCAA